MKETDNSPVQLERQKAASNVVRHVQQASKNTGISFGYLMAQAGKESDFQNNSKSPNSSAAGLYQFTKGTWLELIKQHGEAHGLGDLAAKIHKSDRGVYSVSDPATRQQILDLRRDPKLSSMMAGEYAKENKASLERVLGRPVSSTDLYMAHFLGPGGAAKVLKAREENPDQSAAPLLPQAARKNPTVFYDSNHTAQSVAAVYDKIHHSIEQPMRQYAKLEDTPTVSAPPDGEETASVGATDRTPAPRTIAQADQVTHKAHHVKPVAAKAGDPAWPFEQAHWPPAYVPAVSAVGALTATIADRPDQVAYTAESQSADQISAPMPPAPGLPGQGVDKASLDKLLSSVRKGLFG